MTPDDAVTQSAENDAPLRPGCCLLCPVTTEHSHPFPPSVIPPEVGER